jgi:hypothetical protein
MRVTCAHCKRRFDVAHTDVLKEAARLKEERGRGVVPDNVPDDLGNRKGPVTQKGAKRAEKGGA